MQNTVRSDLAGLADIELDAPSIIVVGEVAALDLPGGGHLPLNGMTVVVTRAQSQSDSLSWALLRAGARVVSLPVIAIADPSDGGTAMCRAVNLLGQHHYDWIVFSSVNAVNRLVSMLGDTRDVGGARLAAVGDATAAALAAHGLPTDLVPQSSSAEALADAMPPGVQSATMPPGVQSATMPPGVQSATMPPGVQSTAMPPGVQSTAMPPGVQSTAMPPGVQSTANSAPVRTPRGRVLFPRAAEAREVLADRLRSKGWEVDEVEAYRTVAAGPDEGVTEDVLDAASGADVVTFTSPSTVRFYLELSGRRGVPSVVACIGPVTAQAASRAGLHVDVVAEEQSVAGLVRALVAKLGDPDV